MANPGRHHSVTGDEGRIAARRVAIGPTGNDHRMSLLPLPSATLDDATVSCVLHRAVDLINPALDLLWDTDPIGLKKRPRSAADAGAVGATLDAAAWVLNTFEVPGTTAWEDSSLDDRIDWWVHRVGAADTVLVAFPGVFGVVADRLPIQDVLGFANQAIVLCAVAREMGVTDRHRQAVLLGAVLCDRDLSDDGTHVEIDPEDGDRTGLPQTLWRLAGVLRAVGAELERRPRPRAVFRYLGVLPGVGAVADYLGEYGALVRAAKQGRRWIDVSATPTNG